MENENEDKHHPPEPKKTDSEVERSKKPAKPAEKSGSHDFSLPSQRPPKPIPSENVAKKDGAESKDDK